MKLMKLRIVLGEKGQAAVFITILLMFAFIALAALAIDGGHLYVVRRDLQNICDAACLAAAVEVANGGTDEEAWPFAESYVEQNGGELPPGWVSPDNNVGDGTGLTWGIEVEGGGVRVALQTVVDTYFTMIFNRQGAGVGARARCNQGAGFGPLLPIAVRRFEYSDDPEEWLDLLANKDADPRNPGAACQGPGDCAYDATSDEIMLPGRYSNGENTFPFKPVKEVYEPVSGTVEITQTGNIDCDLPPQDGTYEGVCVLGVHPETNDGTENYTGWVALDIRNIVGPGGSVYDESPYYLNEATGQAATNKDLSSQWFCNRGWSGDIMPMLGDQLAFLPGVSADFAPKGMLACDPPWKPKDTFIGIIYSGYVWDIPDLEVEIEPAYDEISATIPPGTHTITYTVTLRKPPPSPDWPAPGNFIMTADFTAPLPPEMDADISFSPSVVPLATNQTETQVDMIVSVSDPMTPTNHNYVSAITVKAAEIGIGLKRWASTNFAYRGDSDFDSMKDFTLHAHALEFNAVQGAKVTVILPTMAFGFSENNADVSGVVHGNDWANVFTPASQDQKIDIPNDTDRFDLRVQSAAPIGAHTVTLTVAPKEEGVPEHSVDIIVHVREASGGDPTRFVIVEGFADFQIEYIDVNDVIAYAIGPIVSQITATELFGMRPALLPW